jgi:hypothetical protein
MEWRFFSTQTFEQKPEIGDHARARSDLDRTGFEG